MNGFAMLPDYRLTTCLLALCSSGFIFMLVRRNMLHASYALWWGGAGIIILLAGIFPQGVDLLGAALGVSYPPVLFLTLTSLALALRLLLADIERTRMEIMLRRMAQRQARLALQVQRLERSCAAEGIPPGKDGAPSRISGDDAPNRR